MNAKRPGSPFESHDTDSRRLTEAFFTQSPVKKSSSKKPFIFLFCFGIALLGITLYITQGYHFIVIPKTAGTDSGTGLLTNGTVTSITFINPARMPAKIIDSSISLAIPREGKIGVVFNLAKPYNLHNKTVIFAVQNTTAPLMVDVVVKDVYFRSTATDPLRVALATSKDAFLTTVPISFNPEKNPGVNFSRVNQIKVFFRYDTDSQVTAIPVRVWEKQWVIIKDVLLVEKEENV